VTIPLAQLVSHLDSLLRIAEVPDDPAAVNGLQVECRGEIGRIIAAVDASQATIDRAVEASKAAGVSSLLLVHHGLFWDGNVAVTGRRYRRLKALLDHDLALYSAHIALDLHPELGNNILLARALKLEVQGWFGRYKGVEIGVRGRLPRPTPRADLARSLAEALGIAPGGVMIIPGGPPLCERVGIITGAASRQVADAAVAGLDTFVTGEGPHHSFFDAMEGGINLLFGGHYATETLGVATLARHLGERFTLPWVFHDHPTGL
jgi:dinuclear metal center YbgI/SA1388 family protein